MPLPSVTALVDDLRRLRLLEAEQVAELGDSFADPKSLARTLLDRGWLTAYQANQLLQGKGADLVLGNYILQERLGEGGMGAVYKARHRTLGRIVAVKVIRKERLANPDAIRRFRREIKAAAQLNHPNIVRAFDADEVGGTHLLVMEYVPGTDLARQLKERGPLPIGEACDYVRQAALGLQHAHEKSLVHRDIKPANLLLASGTVKILDMGLARARIANEDSEASSTMTQEGAVMGSPDYIAPEQALESHTVDIRADLYSLGCSFYQLLTGRVPFPTGTLLQKFNKHQFEEPMPVEQLRPEVPAAVAAVVRRLMAKKPQDRFQTPSEVVHALTNVATGPRQPSERLQPPLPQVTDAARSPETFRTPFSAGDTVTEAVSARRARREAERRRWLILNAVGGGVLVIVLGVLVFLFARSGGSRPTPTQAAAQTEPILVVSSNRKTPPETKTVRLDPATVPPGEWEDLFNGRDLTGWEVKQGPADAWSVQGGVLVARGDRGLLGTRKTYRDFALHLEWRIPAGGNSGVYLRVPAAGNPITESMEIQILDDRGTAPGSCGSLYNLVAPARNPFNGADQWNSFDIVCSGERLYVTFNGEGVLNVDLAKDPVLAIRSKEGYIGLQSHTRRTEFRNVRIKDPTGQAAPPTGDGWQPLFNGKDLAGFRTVGVAEDTFQVINGEIRCSGMPNGYLATAGSFRNYHLRFEVKHTHVAGSTGVFLHVQPPYQVWPQCIEAKAAQNDMGSFYARAGAQIIFGSGSAQRTNVMKPVGQWNVFEVTSNEGRLTATVNGTKISDAGSALKEGPIGWKSEGAEVWFRNIEVKGVDGKPLDAGWRSLFNGKNLDGWEDTPYNPDNIQENYTVAQEEGEPAIRSPGPGRLHLVTREQFENYHLRLQFKLVPLEMDRWFPAAGRDERLVTVRYHRPGRTAAHGSKIDIPWGPDPGAVICLTQRTVDAAAFVGGKLATREKSVQPVPLAPDARKPVGQWNTLEIICLGAATVHRLNGQVVCVTTNGRDPKPDGQFEPVMSGAISLGVSRGDIFYRRIEIRPITAWPPEALK